MTASVRLVVSAAFASSQEFEEYKTHFIASAAVIPNVPFSCKVFDAPTMTVFDDTDVILGSMIDILKSG